jgi:flagellar FliL protein
MRNSGKIIILLIPIVLLAAGAGAWFFLLRGRPHAKPPEKSFALALTELTVNLADTGRPHHLSASVTLTLKGAEPEKAAATCDAQIRDAVLMTMSQHRYDELLTPEGKQALREQMLTEVRKALLARKLAVEDVLFTAFLMD